MSNLSKTLRCLNPRTGKRDGKYCTWEGQGKCLLCMAADEIDDLEKILEQTEECYATLITTEIDATNRCKELEAKLDRCKSQYVADVLKLQAKLDAVQWQPIESPPTEAGMYLCLLKNSCHVLYGQPDKWFEPYEVTHWMPLPEPSQALNGEES